MNSFDDADGAYPMPLIREVVVELPLGMIGLNPPIPLTRLAVSLADC